MKTSEFVRKVEGLGYRTSTSGRHILIYIEGYRTPMYVNTKRLNRINSDNLDVPTELFDLCVEYARTPLDEREVEKKYLLKAEGYSPVSRNRYFNYFLHDGSWCISENKDDKYPRQSQFTEEEIKNHKLRYVMAVFEKVEVE